MLCGHLKLGLCTRASGKRLALSFPYEEDILPGEPKSLHYCMPPEMRDRKGKDSPICTAGWVACGSSIVTSTSTLEARPQGSHVTWDL